ncbi:MAG: MBOAT family protein [Clostridiales bacterium]|nr:MBOAT family protein [Clostridiales bacterium]
MAFQTFSYFVFIFVMVIGYYALPTRMRWVLLLAGSYFFYMCWNATYALLLLFSTVITFAASLLIDSANRKGEKYKKHKKIYVALSLICNLGILFFFKYWNMIAATLNDGFTWLAIPLQVQRTSVLLPVGISFYIFQALGYTIDVYRGDVKATRHFGKYALFVSFFPQLVAGPIERSSNLLYQFDEIHRPNFDVMRAGAIKILVGLIKKVLIADRLAVLVDIVFSNAEQYGAPAYIVAVVCFAFQIYCDFSGYSDIAIGSAGLLGFRLMQNFDRPYFSTSIAEFWRRWHISLSSWFRDYLYFPLGGSRRSMLRWALNTMIVFLVSGLWHGAEWTFVAWGGLNGLYQIVGRVTKSRRDHLIQAVGMNPDGRLRQVMAMFCTFVLTCFAWLLFRADNFTQLQLIFSRLISTWEFDSLLQLIHLVNGRECLLMAILVLSLLVIEWISQKHDLYAKLITSSLPLRWSVYLALMFVLILFGKYNESPSFIYFQF